MFRNTAKKMISRLLATALSASLVFGAAPFSLEAQAATGSWELTSESVSICIGYKDSNYENHDVIIGDGNSPITSGETISADKTHSAINSYVGKFDGSVQFIILLTAVSMSGTILIANQEQIRIAVRTKQRAITR